MEEAEQRREMQIWRFRCLEEEKRGAQTIFKPQAFGVFKIDSQNTAEDNQSQVIDSVPGNFFLKTI